LIPPLFPQARSFLSNTPGPTKNKSKEVYVLGGESIVAEKSTKIMGWVKMTKFLAEEVVQSVDIGRKFRGWS